MWNVCIGSFGAKVELCIVAAFALDLALGDPRWLPHPVRLIGKAAGALEHFLTRWLGRNRMAGTLFTATIVGATWTATVALLWCIAQFDWRAAAVAETLLMYTAFAARDLDAESRLVFLALEGGNLSQARRNLSQIVGRDTAQLDEAEVVRAAVETVAENTVDGVVSPLVFALIGGAPAALAYKAINTLDSLVGHLDERHRLFGWASARLDDAANYLPARVTRILFPAACLACGLDALRCWKIAWRDGHKSPSPNAGIPEAAVAGALGVQLGGVNYYDGKALFRPFLGDPVAPFDRRQIPATIRLMYVVAFLTLGVGLAIRMLACHDWS